MEYELYQNTNQTNSCCGRWFTRAMHVPMSFRELCHHVASHSRIIDESTVVAVMTALEADGKTAEGDEATETGA